MAPDKHPPMPGPVVQPNFLSVLEALGEVTFPISKRDLLEQIEEGDGTAMLAGRNVDLHELIKDIHDDFFEDEAELQAALERHYATTEDKEEVEPEPTVPPAQAQEPWQPRVGSTEGASTSSLMEPSRGE